NRRGNLCVDVSLHIHSVSKAHTVDQATGGMDVAAPRVGRRPGGLVPDADATTAFLARHAASRRVGDRLPGRRGSAPGGRNSSWPPVARLLPGEAFGRIPRRLWRHPHFGRALVRGSVVEGR